MKTCPYCGRENDATASACKECGTEFQDDAQANSPKTPSVWKKDLSSYIWPWLEPVLGVIFLIDGVKTIITHEYRYRMWIYHGATAELAGILMMLGAYLLFRGLIWRRRGWSNWSILDKVVGACVGSGFLFFVALRWIAILR